MGWLIGGGLTGLAEVDASVCRLFHWGAFADKFGGTVQETTLYGATVKVRHGCVVCRKLCCCDCATLMLSVLKTSV